MAERDPDAAFREARPRLLRLAYRMLGSIADAEDVVQDACARWLATDPATVRQPAALLRTIVVRLCLNELNSTRRKRETYIGPWLPEPMVEVDDAGALDDITLPLMIALERLSPLERAAFLLHDVFGLAFAEVGHAVGREAAACRKLASRARAHVRAARPRFPVSREQGRRIAAAFFAASRGGDIAALGALLADDVVAYSDGGGKVKASLHPLRGSAVIERHVQLARAFAAAPSLLLYYATIDGLPGFVTIEEGGIVQTTALAIDQGLITAIYVTRNPDKLRHLGAASLH